VVATWSCKEQFGLVQLLQLHLCFELQLESVLDLELDNGDDDDDDEIEVRNSVMSLTLN